MMAKSGYFPLVIPSVDPEEKLWDSPWDAFNKMFIDSALIFC